MFRIHFLKKHHFVLCIYFWCKIGLYVLQCFLCMHFIWCSTSRFVHPSVNIDACTYRYTDVKWQWNVPEYIGLDILFIVLCVSHVTGYDPFIFNDVCMHRLIFCELNSTCFDLKCQYVVLIYNKGIDFSIHCNGYDFYEQETSQ